MSESRDDSTRESGAIRKLIDAGSEIAGGAIAGALGFLATGPLGAAAELVPTEDGRACTRLTACDRPLDRLVWLLDHPRLRVRHCRYTGKPVVAPSLRGVLPRTVADRILLVGEAAGQVKTITGGGVCYGLLAAEIAVDVLTRALAEDDLSAESLAEYDRRWRSVLGREVEVGAGN